jgi:3-oxoacyl-[acyl-carrier protein] reductase
MTPIDFSEQVALVTGGSRGIGEATVKLLAQAGATVAFTYQSREAAAKKVEDAVKSAGGVALKLKVDLSKREGCEQSVRETVKAFNRLDMFVANAGIWPPEDVAVRDMDPSRWRTTMAVNLDSVFYGTRAALRSMMPGGRVVIVSSTAGQRGEGYHADYAATKGAIISFVKSVCIEAASDKITVNAVAPGWVDTDMAQVAYERDGGKGKWEIERTIPLRRVANAEDIAGPILFLLSPLARHVTGEILNVNGGGVLCG